MLASVRSPEVALTAVAVARPVAAALHGPARPARVIGVYPGAAYLAVGAGLVALTALDAERLPFGIEVPLVSRRDGALLGLVVGARATMGGGALRFPTPAVRIVAPPKAAWDPRPAVVGLDGAPDAVRARVGDLQQRLAAWARADSLVARL